MKMATTWSGALALAALISLPLQGGGAGEGRLEN